MTVDSGRADPRLHVLNSHSVNLKGTYVLYWCRMYRRAHDNLALNHAVARANALKLPLVAYEALDVRYPYASDRMHAFVLEGACEVGRDFEARNIAYGFFLPRTREQSHRSRALEKLAEHAAIVVTDWYPNVGGPSSLWAKTPSISQRIQCRVEAYDDAAIVPMSSFSKHEVAARTIRRRVQELLATSLGKPPDPSVRAPILREMHWPFEPERLTRETVAKQIAECEIDHTVAPVEITRGGLSEAKSRLKKFVASKIKTYADERNDMARVVTSRLSPYVHFGQISARNAVLLAQEANAPSESIGAFVEEITVRRALAFNHVMYEPRHNEYAAVPAWAQKELNAHRNDSRISVHTLEQWERAETADPIWNAAQLELRRDGVIHPYARMLWGKVGIALAKRPEDAFAWLIYLNDKYALDGRDPNSYTNIGWCFGLHDHPFPTRAIYGTVRSMTSQSAARKWDVNEYLARVGAPKMPEKSGRDASDQRTLWDTD